MVILASILLFGWSEGIHIMYKEAKRFMLTAGVARYSYIEYLTKKETNIFGKILT